MTRDQATIDRINAEREIPLERYEEEGAKDRYGYLSDLAENHGLTFAQIAPLVDLLGPGEDFDGLVVALEDGADALGGHDA